MSSKNTIVSFTRKIRVDVYDVPENFDEMILDAFKDYTHGTRKSFMYQDKLSFIDCMTKYLHKANDSVNCVKDLILRNTEWQLDEYGELPDKDEFWSLDFMADCYENGQKNASLYDHYTGDHHIDDKIMLLLVRAIKVVMNYEVD